MLALQDKNSTPSLLPCVRIAKCLPHTPKQLDSPYHLHVPLHQVLPRPLIAHAQS
jgi:hypothetical protein